MKIFRNSCWAALLLLLSILSAFTARAEENDSAKLNQTIKEYTEAAKRLDAFSAPYYNVEEDLEKFGDYLSPEYFARAKKIYKVALTGIKHIKPETLPAKDKRTYLLFKEDMEVMLGAYDFPFELLEFTQMSNRARAFMDESSRDLTYFPFDTVKRYEAFAKRMGGFPAYVDRQIAVFRRGIREKITLSCVVAGKLRNTYTDALEKNVEKNPFWRPILFMPESFSQQDRERISSQFRSAISSQVIPAYRKLDAFIQKGYLPHCRKEYGTGSLPRARAWYAYLIRANTNLGLDPNKVHKTGLSEVARITAEIESIRKEIGFAGNRKQFLKSLTNDPKYYFKSASELFQAFEKAKQDIAARVPKYFSLVPKGDYKIVESSNPEDAAASYFMPTETSAFGKFVVNTKNLKATPTYGVTTLSIHEAVPGHHFQLALQFEMKDELSEYQRKIYGSNAFAEGWALYAEYLGREMGAFSDPMQRLGNLNDEMLRAVRLVVDTGIHSLGWSRKKTIDYMSEYLASDPRDIETEADRYSVWPGQALGYKIGQLKIIELRKLAERELGSKFDIREFHKVVIGNGSVSLGVLESQVMEWITHQLRNQQ